MHAPENILQMRHKALGRRSATRHLKITLSHNSTVVFSISPRFFNPTYSKCLANDHLCTNESGPCHIYNLTIIISDFFYFLYVISVR